MKDASHTFKVTVKKGGDEPPPKDKGEVSIGKIKDVEVEKGKKEKVKISLDRKEYEGDVTLTVKAGDKLKKVNITKEATAKEDDAEIVIDAAADASGSDEVTITASGKGLKKGGTASFKVTVK
jgi:hypothetical protein